MVLQAEKVLLREQTRERRPKQVLTVPEAVNATKVIYIQATAAKLDYPLIPFAVLKHDPIAAVRCYLEEQLSLNGGKEIDEELLYDAWNSLFAELLPDQQFFLYAWSSVPEVSSAILQTMGLVFTIATPGPLHTRWLTTRPIWHEGELAIWCVPVDMHHVKREWVERVLLSEDNMLHFASADSWLCGSSKNGEKC